jgi:hypothetical protein
MNDSAVSVVKLGVPPTRKVTGVRARSSILLHFMYPVCACGGVCLCVLHACTILDSTQQTAYFVTSFFRGGSQYRRLYVSVCKTVQIR